MRNAITFALMRDARKLPVLSDGPRDFQVVFLDEPVGPKMREVRDVLGGAAHIFVVNPESKKLNITALLNMQIETDPEAPAMSANDLKSSISFGTFIMWLQEIHDGSPIRFNFDDVPGVGVSTEDLGDEFKLAI